MTPLLGCEFWFQNCFVLLFTDMVLPLLLLSLTGTIAGEELVPFDGRDLTPVLRRFGISPWSCGNKKLFDTQNFSDLLSCLAAISCHLGGAGLVLATFRLPVSGLVTTARNVSDFLFRILVTMSSRFALFKFQNLLFVLAS